MSGAKQFSCFNKPASVALPNVPESAYKVSAQIDNTSVANSFFMQNGWFTETFDAPGYIKHDSDELIFFGGGVQSDHENLNAEIEIWIENDKFTITETAVLFVPAGVAVGNLSIKRLDKPVFYYVCQITAPVYQYEAAEATAEVGKYLPNIVYRYERPDGQIPGAPEGFVTFLLYLDGEKAPDAPYMETVWFNTSNDTGPAPHAHEFDELIGFIGSNPDDPTALQASVQLDYEGELVTVTESTVAYIPRGTMHSPILVPEMDKPIYHFSIANSADYDRDVAENNEYKPE
jgi:hypothetical protein